MNEKLVIVPTIKSVRTRIFNVVWFVLTCSMISLSMQLWICIILAVIFGVIWVIRTFYSNVEFEYTYYEGEFRFARIKNKSKRKHLTCVNMDDVIAFAPRGDRSVYKYENDKSLTCKDLTSGDPEAKVYELVFKKENEMCRYEFEPDDEMLDAVMVKYARSVIR